jgi:hypothetical protein
VNARRLVEEARAQMEKRLADYEQPRLGDTNLRDIKSTMEAALAPHGLQGLAEKLIRGL